MLHALAVAREKQATRTFRNVGIRAMLLPHVRAKPVVRATECEQQNASNTGGDKQPCTTNRLAHRRNTTLSQPRVPQHTTNTCRPNAVQA